MGYLERQVLASWLACLLEVECARREGECVCGCIVCCGVDEEKEDGRKKEREKRFREKTVTFKYPDGEGEIRVRNCFRRQGMSLFSPLFIHERS